MFLYFLLLVVTLENTLCAPPQQCVYGGGIDVNGQIQQLRNWMSTALPLGRTDAWWLASYLADADFDIEHAKAHIAAHYQFKKQYPQILQEREWFVEYLQQNDGGLSPEARKSNELLLELLDNGVLLTLFSTPDNGDSISILRLGVVPDDVSFFDIITLFTMYLDVSNSFLNPFLVQSALDWSRLVCQGHTIPFSSTSDNCKNLVGYGITQPNPNYVSSVLALFQQSESEFLAEMTRKFLLQNRAGVTVIVDTNGVDASRLQEFSSAMGTIAEFLLSGYPIRLNTIHVFNNNPTVLHASLEGSIIELETTFADEHEDPLAQVLLHGGDFSILEQCGIPQSSLPKEYGGSSGTIAELTEIWKILLLGGAQAYDAENQFSSFD